MAIHKMYWLFIVSVPDVCSGLDEHAELIGPYTDLEKAIDMYKKVVAEGKTALLTSELLSSYSSL